MLIGIDAHNLEGKRTGVGRYVFNLLNEWSKVDSGVKFVLYFKDEIPADIPKSDNFECRLLKVGSTAKFMNWDLARAAKKDKVDVLFCPDYRAPIVYQGKTAITLHDISYEARPEYFDWPSLADKILLKWASKKTAQKAELIFTPSDFSRQEVIKYYALAPEKVVATPLAVSPFLSGVVGQADEIKEKYGLNNEFGFFVGSMFTRRHLAEVIAAFEEIAKENKGQLLLGGKDQTSGRSIEKLIKKTNERLGYQAVLRVDFIGDEELKLLYSACAFFIWLSDYEGFGLPVLEAMSLGAPVITTDGSSLSEVAGEAALLIKDNRDIKEIWRAMHKILRDKALREGLSAKGKKQADNFSWAMCATKTLKYLTANNE